MAIIFFHRGTERQNVADDYAKRLHIGQVECESLIADIAGTFISDKSGSPPPNFQTCELLNISICPATEQGNVSIYSSMLVLCTNITLKLRLTLNNTH